MLFGEFKNENQLMSSIEALTFYFANNQNQFYIINHHLHSFLTGDRITIIY